MLAGLVNALFLALGVTLLVLFVVVMIVMIVVAGAFVEWIVKK